MTERPLLMSTAMIQAFMAGRKMQARRPVKLPPWLRRMKGDLSKAWVDGPCFSAGQYLKVPCTCDDSGEAWDDTVQRLYCPWGEPGEDGLYFRETFFEHENGEVIYRADSDPMYHNWKWQPSIFMPKRLARFHVPLTKVRVERVQSISEADAIAEGVEAKNDGVRRSLCDMVVDGVKVRKGSKIWCKGLDNPIAEFSMIWDSIHGKKPEYKWSANPWVFVLEFPKYNAKETT